jgi:hypothetical protein
LDVEEKRDGVEDLGEKTLVAVFFSPGLPARVLQAREGKWR